MTVGSFEHLQVYSIANNNELLQNHTSIMQIALSGHYHFTGFLSLKGRGS